LPHTIIADFVHGKTERASRNLRMEREPSPPRDCKAGILKPPLRCLCFTGTAGRMLARNAAKPGDRRSPQSRFAPLSGLHSHTVN